MRKRTPRNFDGIESPGKKLGDLANEVLVNISRSAFDIEQSVFLEWNELLGSQSSMTEPQSLENGVLTVKVKSAALYSLLCQHEKSRLLKRLRKKFPIRNIVFRVG